MEEEKKLYPLKFCSLQDDYPWGGETFVLADLGYRDSLVREGWLAGNSLSELMDTYLDRVVGDGVYEFYGRQFPLCVRLIRCRGRMPLRVHPDDETAAQRYDFLGKEKLWYVLRAGAGARLMAGFRRDTDASEVYAKCLDGSVEDILNVVAPHPGQALRIPAGTPHAAAGDVEILEIGESSPMDFCLCGWGEEVHPDEFDPALTLVDALDFIDYRQFQAKSAASGRTRPVAPGSTGDPVPGAELLVALPQLRVERIPLVAALQFSRELGPFLLYSCVRGAASLQLSLPGSAPSPGTSRPGGGSPLSDDRGLDVTLRAGETVLVPAEVASFALVPTERDTVLLESTVVPDDTDPYINPAAAPTLPDDD
ncbi:MAG: hypothetical protein GXY24_06260 [Bacteroidales bacterium]|mgnify:CR=1 FL=1|nr:hypothetical protein [Bacteroidales bacterium]